MDFQRYNIKEKQKEKGRKKKIENNVYIEPKLLSDNAGIKKYLLANNVEVLVRENTSNDIIAMEVFAKGGKLLEQKAGVGSILATCDFAFQDVWL